jgi:hypothetical protein
VDALDLARWQFGIITVYHFLFVPVTIGLSAIVAGNETAWVRTKNPQWLRLTKSVREALLRSVVWITHEPIRLDRVDVVVRLEDQKGARPTP